MPMNHALYPKNWNDIARFVKNEANWRCENCDRPCRQPGEDWNEFKQKLIDAKSIYWYRQTYREVSDDEHGNVRIDCPQRFTLTTAHLDHNPGNCDRANLKALCSVCHLKYDREHHRKTATANRYRRREEAGQLSFLIELAGHGKDPTRIQLTIGHIEHDEKPQFRRRKPSARFVPRN